MPNHTNSNGQVLNVQYESDSSSPTSEQEVRGHYNNKTGGPFHVVGQSSFSFTSGEFEYSAASHRATNDHHTNSSSTVHQDYPDLELDTHTHSNANDQGYNTVTHTRINGENEVVHLNSHSAGTDLLI